MKFKNLLSIMIYYNHNFKILHWKCKGDKFETYHELTSNYYNQLEGYIDKVAEIGLTYDEQPIGLVEAFDILKEDKERDYKILDPSKDYDEDEIIENIDIMFKDIMSCIKELLKESKIEDNPGTRSELENMYSWLDIECNYKNKRRKK